MNWNLRKYEFVFTGDSALKNNLINLGMIWDSENSSRD